VQRGVDERLVQQRALVGEVEAAPTCRHSMRQ
jgi:hypothetical protein